MTLDACEKCILRFSISNAVSSLSYIRSFLPMHRSVNTKIQAIRGICDAAIVGPGYVYIDKQSIRNCRFVIQNCDKKQLNEFEMDTPYANQNSLTIFFFFFAAEPYRGRLHGRRKSSVFANIFSIQLVYYFLFGSWHFILRWMFFVLQLLLLVLALFFWRFPFFFFCHNIHIRDKRMKRRKKIITKIVRRWQNDFHRMNDSEHHPEYAHMLGWFSRCFWWWTFNRSRNSLVEKLKVRF